MNAHTLCSSSARTEAEVCRKKEKKQPQLRVRQRINLCSKPGIELVRFISLFQTGTGRFQVFPSYRTQEGSQHVLITLPFLLKAIQPEDALCQIPNKQWGSPALVSWAALWDIPLSNLFITPLMSTEVPIQSNPTSSKGVYARCSAPTGLNRASYSSHLSHHSSIWWQGERHYQLVHRRTAERPQNHMRIPTHAKL